MHSKALLSAAILWTLSLASPLLPRALSLSNAQQAFTQLQQWYDPSTGLWDGMWWHSGNVLSTICSLANLDPSLKPSITNILANTYTAAPQYTYGQKSSTGFIGDYYDDEAWWALGWIDAYDLTGTMEYLQTAERIYQDMYQAFGTTGCGDGEGGIWWNKARTYINSIANELFLALAAALATRSKAININYTSTAQSQWNFLQQTGLLTSQNLLVDGLLVNCQPGQPGTWEGNIWTYNQGVLLPALVTLGDLSSAHSIASATLSSLTSNGILQDPCEHNSTVGGANTCDGDQTQFKGIFARNLMQLQRASPRDEYAEFLDRNAESLWTRGQENGLMSVFWDGPFVKPANASTQSSGLDLLIASLST